MWDRVVSEDPFLMVYCSDKYELQRSCDEAVDDCLAALKLISDCFLQVKLFFTRKTSHWFIRRW